MGRKQKKLDEDNVKNERQSIEDSLSNEKEAAEDSYKLAKEKSDKEYELRVASLEDKIALLEKETEESQKANDKRLENDNLAKEAKLEMEKGLSKELIEELHKYEDKFGLGMGILGDYIHDNLTTQITTAQTALSDLLENVATVGSSGGFNFSSSNDSILAKMKANGEAWAAATDAKERERLSSENEKLGASIGLVKDNGAWYTDEAKTQLAYETLDKLKNKQIENTDAVILKYGEDSTAFNTAQTDKTTSLETFTTDATTKTNTLYTLLNTKLTTYKDDFSIATEDIEGYVSRLITKIELAINSMNDLFTSANQISDVQLKLTTIRTLEDGSKSTSVAKFHDGGIVGKIQKGKDEGIAVVKVGERILTPYQTKNYDTLVETMKNYSPMEMGAVKNMTNDMLQNKNVLNVGNVVPNSGSIEADFNFYGGVTQEAVPQIKAFVNDAINKLAAKVPAIASNARIEGASRLGYNMPR